MPHLEETWYHPYSEAWWWQHHAVGVFFSGRFEAMMNGAKYREILDENLLQSAQDLRLGAKAHLPTEQRPKHTAKTTQEWFRDKSLNVLSDPARART